MSYTMREHLDQAKAWATSEPTDWAPEVRLWQVLHHVEGALATLADMHERMVFCLNAFFCAEPQEDEIVQDMARWALGQMGLVPDPLVPRLDANTKESTDADQ